MADDALGAEPHEGDWLYVQAPLCHLEEHAAELVEGITRIVGSAGRLPLLSPETHGSTRAPHAEPNEALALAQALIVDLSTDAQAVGADVGCAIAAGRPIIGLEHDAAPAGELLSAAVTADGRGRLIRYGEPRECLAQLEATLEDGSWWGLVAAATPRVSA